MTDAAATTATTSTTSTAPEMMTPAEATAKLAELTANKEWSGKLLSGDPGARKEFDTLMSKKDVPDRIEAALAGRLQPPEFETVTGGQLSTRNLLSGIQDLRDLNIDDHQIGRLLKDEPISAEDRASVEKYEREILGSSEFVKRFLAGDLAARREVTLTKLHKLRPIAK